MSPTPPSPDDVDATKAEAVSEASAELARSPEAALIAELQLPRKEPTFRYTVDLPESLHKKLSLAAAKTGRSKADIVRYLLQQALGGS